MADNDDFGVYATEIFENVWAEVTQRAPNVSLLDQRDLDAVTTAIAKGAWRGILRGIAHATHEINEKLREMAEAEGEEPYEIDPRLAISPEPDLWAQRYAEEEE